MAQIVQPQPTWQEALGSGLGSGIQSGVTALLEQKLQSMAQEQQANQRMKALEGLQKAGVLGKEFTPESLSALKYVPETTLNTIIKQKLLAPQNEAFARALGLTQPEGQQTGTPSEQMAAPALSNQQAYQLKQIQLAEEKNRLRREEALEKRIEPQESELRSKYVAGPERRKAAQTIIASAKSGQMRSPEMQGIINKFGLQDIFTGNTTSQLAQASMNQLATGAGNAFNTRNLTNLDVGIYKRALPNALQTPEGQVALGKNILLEEDANELRYKTFVKLAEKSLTRDILDRVETQIEPELKKLGNEAITNLLTAEFPDANTYPNNSVVRDPDTGYLFKVVGNKYEWMGEQNGQAS